MSVGPPGSYLVAPTILVDGYEISGDVRSGLHATVPYLVAWQDAMQFGYNALKSPTAVRVGGISWAAPYQLPLLVNGVQPPLYCNRLSIKPCGASGSIGTTSGINPGEYFTWAKVILGFDNVAFLQNAGDDPQGLNQLDPSNPITACEQSVKISGKVVTRKGAGYTYDSTSKPVTGDIPVVLNEVKLILNFPRVPYLPWQAIQGYVGLINSAEILQCVKGSLLFEGTDIKSTPSLQGFNESVSLQFAFNPDPTGASEQGLDWNSFPLPDGSGYSMISAAGGGGERPYSYANMAAIFSALEF